MIKFLFLILFVEFLSLNLFSQELEYHHFEGKINNETNLMLDLTFENQDVIGFYVVGDQKRKTLKGTVSQDSILQLFEIFNSNDKNKKGEFFQGSIYQSIFSGSCNIEGQKALQKFFVTENYQKSVPLKIVNIKKSIYIDSIFPEVKVSISYAYPYTYLPKLRENIMKSYFDCQTFTNLDSCVKLFYEPLKQMYQGAVYTGPKNWEFNLQAYVYSNANNTLTINKNLYVFADEYAIKSEFEYLVFDVKTGQEFNFDDIVQSKSKKDLIKIIKSNMEEQGFDKDLVSSDNTTNVGIDNYGIHFLYNLFQTDDFIVNIVEVDLKFDDIKEFLNPFILKRWNSEYN